MGKLEGVKFHPVEDASKGISEGAEKSGKVTAFFRVTVFASRCRCVTVPSVVFRPIRTNVVDFLPGFFRGLETVVHAYLAVPSTREMIFCSRTRLLSPVHSGARCKMIGVGTFASCPFRLAMSAHHRRDGAPGAEIPS